MTNAVNLSTVAAGGVGASGTVLTSQGASAAPAWKNPGNMPVNTQIVAYTLVAGDAGDLVVPSGANTVTVPPSVFSAGDVVTICNHNPTSMTIAQGTGLTLYQAGTANTGNRTLAQRGLATIVFVNPTVAIITGGGLT